ncbi:uncharacterized protein LOC113215891 isoform X1 [Frankliniella occidentalis]|uniref:Uncharacterized protein LOC113215891 isoform X1 n=2 Tax=Frankliniella occidentalis TaxID=133901 RepID=A0A9C6WZU0_FRAOC|nr:uncharacterized protein LOC113215891 isoform X1 [Frankliniella occidentalis]
MNKIPLFTLFRNKKVMALKEARASCIDLLLVIGFTSTLLNKSSIVEGKDEHTTLVSKFYEMKHCTDKKHHIRLSNVTFTAGRHGGNLASADVRYNKGLTSITRISALLNKCGTGPEHCEYFTTWRWDRDVCNMVLAKGMAWTPIVNAIKPSVHCPVQPGPYRIVNATVDWESFERLIPILKLEDQVFKIAFMLYNERKELSMCIQAIVGILRVRA